MNIPKEIEIYGIYFPPLLLATGLGLVAAWVTAHLLNRFQVSQIFAFPPIVFLAMVALFTCLIGTFLFPI